MSAGQTQDPFSIENLTKIIGVFTAVALGTGILFDVVFLSVISCGFFELLVLSDHIESAAASVPLLLVFFILIAGGFWTTRRQQRGPRFAIGIIALMILMWGVLSFMLPAVYGLPFDPKIAISTGLMALLYGAAVAAGVLAPTMPKGWLVLLLGTAWICLTVIRSATEAYQVADSSRFSRRPPTEFYLAHEGKVTGHIIRLIDKGAIIHSAPGGHYIFIPKDQIRRIDSFPPTYSG